MLSTTAHATRWNVITGAPCSGKTSVIKALEDRGHRVVHEAARSYIDTLISNGTPLDEIKSDILAFERHILEAKITIETSLPRDHLIFLDRAIPDSIAYYRLEGLCADEVFAQCRMVEYRRVFLFERFEFEKDGVRTENHAEAGRIEALLIQGYEALGYDLIRVPPVSIEERTAIVLNHLSEA